MYFEQMILFVKKDVPFKKTSKEAEIGLLVLLSGQEKGPGPIHGK